MSRRPDDIYRRPDYRDGYRDYARRRSPIRDPYEYPSRRPFEHGNDQVRDHRGFRDVREPLREDRPPRGPSQGGDYPLPAWDRTSRNPSRESDRDYVDYRSRGVPYSPRRRSRSPPPFVRRSPSPVSRGPYYSDDRHKRSEFIPAPDPRYHDRSPPPRRDSGQYREQRRRTPELHPPINEVDGRVIPSRRREDSVGSSNSRGSDPRQGPRIAVSSRPKAADSGTSPPPIYSRPSTNSRTSVQIQHSPSSTTPHLKSVEPSPISAPTIVAPPREVHMNVPASLTPEIDAELRNIREERSRMDKVAATMQTKKRQSMRELDLINWEVRSTNAKLDVQIGLLTRLEREATIGFV